MAAVVIDASIAYEIRNSVLMGIRRGRIGKPDGEQFLLSLNELNVRLSEPARTMTYSPSPRSMA
jgi:hypothetical protein